MKHSPVLLLGVTTLILGNASAAAQVSLSFVPAKPVAPTVAVMDTSASVKQRTAEDMTLNLPDKPITSSLLALADRLSDHFDRPDPVQTPPETRTPEPEPSPFEWPANLTDADLYEPDSFHDSKPDIESPSAGQPSEQNQAAMRPSAPLAERGNDADRLIAIPKVRSSESFPVQPDRELGSAASSSTRSIEPSAATQPLELDFALPSSSERTAAVAPVPPPLPAKPEHALTPPKSSNENTPGSLDVLFAGESESLVAIAVGSAEGTRTPDGGRNPAYHGHVDPGNGVWNLGSFSYQHGASSPEEADAKQLARLRSQAETILQKAVTKGLDLTLEAKLNGIDLANQAPKAALDQQGYIDWLAEAYQQGLSGSDAILRARVQSFRDPYTQTWDAPGLGNSEERITHDQERRMLQIAKAISAYGK